MTAFNLFLDELIPGYDPVVITSNPNAYVVDNGDGATRTAYLGENLTFDGVTGLPNGGTLTSVLIFAVSDGTPLVTLSDLQISVGAYFGQIDELNTLRAGVDWIGFVDPDVDPVTETSTHIVWANTDGTFTELVGTDLNQPDLAVVQVINKVDDAIGTNVLDSFDPSPDLSLDVAYATLFDWAASVLLWDLLNTGDNTLSGVNTSDELGNTYNFQLLDSAGSDILSAASGGLFANFSLSTDAIAFAGGAGLAFHANGEVDQLIGITNVIGTDFNDGLDARGVVSFFGVVYFGGDGDDTIFGSAQGDFLEGGAGTDFIDGGAGVDALRFGDTESTGFNVGGIEVFVDLSLGESYQFGDIGGTHVNVDTILNFENIVGSSLADNITGNAGANQLEGGDGNDGLVGGAGADVLVGGAGLDTMIGGLGDDIYIVDTGDTLSEAFNEGADEARAIANFTLDAGAGANVERLVAFAAGITLTGNSFNNTLVGNGSSTLAGGSGNDVYILASAGDTIIDSSGAEGVQAAFSYVLGADLENLTLTGAAAINGTGNASRNFITGNTGANVLVGLGGNDTLLGGAGADSMDGGAGNDIYFVDNVGDTLTDSSGADTVNSSISFNLAAGFERLTLTGAGANSGTGNALANTINGNGVANTLTGGGGADTLSGNGGNDTLDGGLGADVMSGGLGNDTYVVNNAGDVTVEVTNSSGGGVDTIQSSVTRGLGAGIENLTLTGANAINGTGNGLANIIIGNAAINTLIGGGGNDELRGGDGNDILTGGAGADTFVINTIPNNATNVDTITDFSSVNDTITLFGGIYQAFGGTGPIDAGNLRIGAGANSAADADDFLIYNTTTGALRYDPNGNGAGGGVLIITLTGAPTLTAADIVIV